MFLSIPPFSDHHFPNAHIMKFFMILLSNFCLSLPGEIMPLFTYIRPLQRGGNPTSKQLLNFPGCWGSHSSAHLKILISNDLVSMEPSQPLSINNVRLPNAGGPFPCLWLATPIRGNLQSRLCTKKRTQGKGNQSKTTCAVYRTLNFTNLHGCYLSSPEPQTQMGITRKHLWFKIHFLRQTSTPLARSKCKWSYDQELPLALEDIDESAKALAAQQKSLDSLAKVVLDSRIALDCILAKQGGVCAMANTTCCTWVTLLQKLRLSYIRSLNKSVGLRKWLLPWGISLTYWILICLVLGTMALKCTPDIGNYPTYNNRSSLPHVLYSLKSFKWMFKASNHQANHFPKNTMLERNKENNWMWIRSHDLWMPHRDSAKTGRTPEQ